MSNYWHFECVDHDPPIADDREFTQHTGDDAYCKALALATSRPLTPRDWDGPQLSSHFESNARRFLEQHPYPSASPSRPAATRPPASKASAGSGTTAVTSKACCSRAVRSTEIRRPVSPTNEPVTSRRAALSQTSTKTAGRQRVDS